VATVLATCGGVTDETTLLAAVLHDTIEDTETTAEELAERFGPEVAAVVLEVTDDKSLPKDERKRLQVEHAPHGSPRAKLVKLGDKICNVHDVTVAPPADWTLERRREYLDWTERVIAGCRGASAELESRYDEVLGAARRALDAPPARETVPVEIRPARPDDAPALEPLFDAFDHPVSAAEVRSRWGAFATGSGLDRALVAVLEGRVVGLVTTHATPVLHRPSPIGRITALVVLPGLQGHGIGAQLLAAGEALLREAGVDRIELTSGTHRVDAHRFYERQGYRRDAFRFARQGGAGEG
jgi:guanosine-3',5'-bis(diphosphate) 3'-pyrophosphohydrolase